MLDDIDLEAAREGEAMKRSFKSHKRRGGNMSRGDVRKDERFKRRTTDTLAELNIIDGKVSK